MVRFERFAFALLLTAGIGVAATPARADLVTQTQTIQPIDLDAPFPAVTFNKFDEQGSKYDLVSVQISITGESTGGFTITYGGAGPTTYMGLISGEMMFQAPGQSIFQIPLVVTETKTIDSGSFTASGTTGKVTQVYNYTSDSELSMFEGPGTFSIPVSTFSVPKTVGDTSGALLFTSSNANGSITPNFQSQGSATVTYTYVVPPPVPEPASVALMGLGLAGVGLARRHHARRSLRTPS